jgi:hypothetical protein
MVNQGGSEVGLAGCAAKTSLPIVQDDATNALRTALGAEYNGTLVVDRTGHAAAWLPNLSLSTDAAKLVEAIAPLL